MPKSQGIRKTSTAMNKHRGELAATGVTVAIIAALIAGTSGSANATEVKGNPLGKLTSISQTTTQRLVAPVVPVKYSARFNEAGSNWSSGHHTGLDFVAAEGTPVRAVQAGTIIKVGYEGAYGLQVTLRLNNGMLTTYSHLSSAGVKVGQKILKAQRIGAVGSTGNTTGPHLHFEVIINGTQRNPELYF